MEKEILTLEEAADLFGVSVKTFIKLLKEEKVPARKIGREWRFSKKALIEWLSSGDSQVYTSSEGDAKDFFNGVAKEWDNLRQDYYDETIRSKLLDLNLLNKDMTVLDLGAGDGYISRAIAGQVKKVVAVDISSEMLKTLDEKAKKDGIKNIESLQTEAEDVPLDDASVDVVCASMFLHHIEEPSVAIREMHRLLRPGGTVFLADLQEHTYHEFKTKMHDVWLGFNMLQLKKWFEKNGFVQVHIEMLPLQKEKPSVYAVNQLRSFILTAVKE